MERLSENKIAEILSEHEKWLANPNTGRQAHFKDCEFVGFCFPRYCIITYCTVTYCTVTDCKVTGGTVTGKKLKILKGYSGLYPYNVWAVLFEDGSRWVRMGCLFKSLEEWDKITIRASNVREFPDDGSDKCEERVAAFEFVKAAALRLK